MSGKILDRNPGPSWGYALISAADKALPRAVMNALLDASAFVAMLLMGPQRRHSARFLSQALGRPATWRDCWRRFSAFARFLVRRFRAADGEEPVFHRTERVAELEDLARSGQQALYGTFHYGDSDLMGFWLSRFGVTIRMARHRVGNSQDIRWLERRFGDKVGFIWVNDARDLPFSIKEAIGEGHSIAMKCDRIEHSAKLESFDFLGARRLFPFTIYSLARLFGLPVVFAVGAPQADGSTLVHASRIYRPTPGDRSRSQEEARIHFQETLRMLESLIKANPYQWFNFLSENPEVPAEAVVKAS